jgi:hypothetical protein
MISGGSLKPTSDDIHIADEHMPNILQALRHDKLTISKSLLKSIYWALTLPSSPLKLSRDNNSALVKIAEMYLSGSSGPSAEDKTLSNTAREVLKICKSQS